MGLSTYRELTVWQRAMDLVEEAYRLGKLLPEDKRHALLNQMRRAAVSVPANIAEGYGRSSTGDYKRHLAIAHGSLMELETHIIIGGRLKYYQNEQAKVA